MEIIPAIDILNGTVVRLYKGIFEEKTEYGVPQDLANYWQDQGARYLHVVDLDGAKDGEPKNIGLIEKIIRNNKIPIEVGGGIRTLDHMRRYIQFGADRVVLGSAVAEDPAFLRNKEIQEFSPKIAISCDTRMPVGRVTGPIFTGTEGWTKESKISLDTLLGAMVSAGIKYLNYTVRSKDGTLAGLSDSDIDSLRFFLDAIGDRPIQATYAGGIANLEDIRKLAELNHPKLAGLIIGKALYEGKFNLSQAQEAAHGS